MCWHSAERKCVRFLSFTKFSFFPAMYQWQWLLSAECTMNTHRKICYENKTFITGQKAFHSLDIMRREAEIIEKNGRRMFFLPLGTDNFTATSIPDSALHIACYGNITVWSTLRPTLFANFRLPRRTLRALWDSILWSIISTAKIMTMKQMVLLAKGEEKT